MKLNTPFYLILFLLICNCSSDKQTTNGLAFIDAYKNYPEKEILLTDIADVTYLYLNSDDDDYLYRGTIYCVTKNTIVVCDYFLGNILFFSNDGYPKSRFNHLGNGPEDYTRPSRIVYDEDADEVFIYSRSSNIQVYSSTGEYKRKIVLPQETIVSSMISFDDQSLFLYDVSINLVPDRKRETIDDTDYPTQYYSYPFVRISKIDGKVLDYAVLPIAPISLTINIDGMRISPANMQRLIKCADRVHLCNPESDTVYMYGKDKSLIPVLYKTPAVDSTDPMIYLNNCSEAGQYQFLELVTVRPGEESPGIFPSKCYMRNKTTGEIVRPVITLPDYKGKEFVFSQGTLGDYDTGPIFELDLIELKNAYRENKLSGKLEELVATLNEDEDNNVFMLVNFK